MDPNQLSGFDPRVQQQLSNLSQNQRGRRGSFSSQSTTSQSSYYSTYSTPNQSRGSRSNRGSQSFDRFSAQPPPGIDSFPPLGSQQQNRSANMAPQPHFRSQVQYTPNNGQNQRSQSAAQEFFARSRGRGRGRGPRRGDHFNPSADHSSYSRPPPSQQQLYNPGAHHHYVNSEQREANRQKVMIQSDYLEATVNRSAASMLSTQEIQQKQAFAARIESLARTIVGQYHDQATSPLPQVKLQPYGSLANSFGTTGCDMDLLLTVGVQDNPFMDISEDIKRDLEKALLDQGIGARLLTNTRVPILRICETPGSELLRNLRDHRVRWEMGEESVDPSNLHPSSAPIPHLTWAQEQEQAKALLSLDDSAADVTLPDSPPPNHAKLEYTADCGIQCDVNFANHVALFNSKMLWTYGQCDPRVRHVGIFVKNWAKARDINTPYRGTLSSYGYILMVLHYLMNVVHPPILPNLQQMAKHDGWNETPLELVEGHDVRFVKDPAVIKAHMANMPPNKSSRGALLLGFFRYYGQGPAGFRWIEQVISIRTPGGILTKQDKEWTKAKWSEENTNVRQRYLLAIEDPFEVDHNVGRTVGHNGVVAIRDEFRRAWDIIEKIRSVQSPRGLSWAVVQPDGTYDLNAADLLSTADSRGDLLRKDADDRKLKNEKARHLRQELELKEEMEKKLTLEKTANSQMGNNDSGMWQENGIIPQEDDSKEVHETALLIQNFQHQDSKVSRMRSRRPERERLHDMSDDDDEPEDDFREHEDNAPAATEEIVNTGGYSVATKDTIEPKQNTWEYEQPAVHLDIEGSMTWTAQSAGEAEPDNQFVNLPDTANSNNWNIEPEQEASNRAETWNPDAVGHYINWTQNSKGGRWLLKRDDLIRDGNWIAPTGSELARLNTAFPYDTKMSVQRLASLNAKLEALYRNTIYPAFTSEHDQEITEASRVIVNVEGQAFNKDVLSEPWVSDDHATSLSHGDWAVGENIPWTAENDVGGWLLWRDRKIRAGFAIKAPGWAGIGDKLSELYPYDPRQTMAEVDRMNEELQTHFSDLAFPRKTMPRSLQSKCTELIMNAVQNIMLQREPFKHPTKPHFDGIYTINSSAVVEEAIADHLFMPVKNFDESIVHDFDDMWTSNNTAGKWLRRRDMMILDGSWQPDQMAEHSFFNHLDRLFPYQANISPDIRARQNRELDANFDQVKVPSRNGEYGEPAVRALLRIVEGRKGDLEADRVRILINLFKRQRSDGDVSTQLVKDFSDGKEKNHTDRHREEQVLKKFSAHLDGQRSAPTPVMLNPSQNPTGAEVVNKDLAELRRQRLAYYDKKEPTSNNGKQSVSIAPETPHPKRRDSGVQGSWNDARSPSESRTSNGSMQPEIASNSQSESCAAERSRNVRQAASNPGPQNLFEHDQFDDADIIPIVTSADFEIDSAQMADIKNVKAGGNGCARDG